MKSMLSRSAGKVTIIILTMLAALVVSFMYTMAEGLVYPVYLHSSHRAYIILLTVAMIIIIIQFCLLYRGRHNENLRRIENERYEQISCMSNEILYEYDIHADRLKLPERSSRFIGWSRVTEHASNVVIDMIHYDEYNILKYMVSAKDLSCELICTLSDGSRRWLKIISKIICDEEGSAVYNVGKIVDIHQQKEVQYELMQKARKDALTGTYNPSATREMVECLIQREKIPGALFVVDVDHFKTINDNYGHYTGDEVLIKIAEAFRGVFRKDDVVGRMGGDEFAIYMKSADSKEAIADKCDSLRNKVSKIEFEGKHNVVSLSIGIALAHSGCSFDDLYKQADTALYDVKKDGRNSYKIYEEA